MAEHPQHASMAEGIINVMGSRPQPIKCPMKWCGAYVMLVGIPDMIPLHKMVITGENCPASLMNYPIEGAQIDALLDQEEVMGPRVRAVRADQIKAEESRSSIPQGVDRSRGLGMNRFKTHMNDPAWVLGGRADEDVPASPDNVVPLRPDGAHYGGVYRGGTVESAVNVAVAYANQAVIKFGEANAHVSDSVNQVHALNGAFLDMTGQAKQSLSAATDVVNSERLQTAYAAIRQADDQMQAAFQAYKDAADEAQRSIYHATHQAQEWIGIVTSA